MDAESLLLKLVGIKKHRNVNMFDAVQLFCEESEIEIESIIPLLDKNTIEELKADAIENRLHVNRKSIKIPINLAQYCADNDIDLASVTPLLKSMDSKAIINILEKNKAQDDDDLEDLF